VSGKICQSTREHPAKVRDRLAGLPVNDLEIPNAEAFVYQQKARSEHFHRLAATAARMFDTDFCDSISRIIVSVVFCCMGNTQGLPKRSLRVGVLYVCTQRCKFCNGVIGRMKLLYGPA
jgi:hypothetical protein